MATCVRIAACVQRSNSSKLCICHRTQFFSHRHHSQHVSSKIYQLHNRQLACQRHLLFSKHTNAYQMGQQSRHLSWNTFNIFGSNETPQKEVPDIPENPVFLPPPEGYIKIEEPLPVKELTTKQGIPLSDLELNALGEPTFTSLGLGGYSPIGLVQNSMETLYVAAGIPWWGSIMIVTFFLRACLHPFMVKTKRNQNTLMNITPQLQKVAEKKKKATLSGDKLETYRLTQYEKEIKRRHGVSMYANFAVMIPQSIIFISMFRGLREMLMAVDSMATGGILFTVNLNLPDPTYVMPLLTALTLSATVKVGMNNNPNPSPIFMQRIMLFGLPFGSFCFMSYFPSGLCYYWLTQNTVSLVQTYLLTRPAIMKLCNIPTIIPRAKEKVDEVKKEKSKKSFRETYREAIENGRVASEAKLRDKTEKKRFENALKGPIMKTYPIPPEQKRRMKKDGFFTMI